MPSYGPGNQVGFSKVSEQAQLHLIHGQQEVVNML